MTLRTDTPAEQLFFTTVRVTSRLDGGSAVGTGFVVAVETPEGTVHCLVTNKHVLAGAVDLTVHMVKSEGDAPALGRSTQITITEFSEAAWVGHPVPDVDVAAMPLFTVFEEMQRIGAPPFFRSISPDLFATFDLIASLDAIESVTFIGYPNGLYDTENFLPIARRGTTATPLQTDYQGRPAFLIDASVFQGSSGSPVFLFDRGMYSDRQGNTVIGTRLVLLGIVAAVHVRKLQGQIVQVPTGLAVEVSEPIDLGIVYRSSTILETIDALLERHHRRRIARAPSAQEGEITSADKALADDNA